MNTKANSKLENPGTTVILCAKEVKQKQHFSPPLIINTTAVTPKASGTHLHTMQDNGGKLRTPSGYLKLKAFPGYFPLLKEYFPTCQKSKRYINYKPEKVFLNQK